MCCQACWTSSSRHHLLPIVSCYPPESSVLSSGILTPLSPDSYDTSLCQNTQGRCGGKLLQLKSKACKQRWAIPSEAVSLAHLKTQLSGELMLILVSQWQQRLCSYSTSPALGQSQVASCFCSVNLKPRGSTMRVNCRAPHWCQARSMSSRSIDCLPRGPP